VAHGKLSVFVLGSTRPVTRGAQRGEAPLESFSPPLEKFVGYILKLLDIVEKIWAPLGKLFGLSWCPKLVTGLGSTLSFCYNLP